MHNFQTLNFLNFLKHRLFKDKLRFVRMDGEEKLVAQVKKINLSTILKRPQQIKRHSLRTRGS